MSVHFCPVAPCPPVAPNWQQADPTEWVKFLRGRRRPAVRNRCRNPQIQPLALPRKLSRSIARGGHVCSTSGCRPFGEGCQCVGRRRCGGETGIAECSGACESQSFRAPSEGSRPEVFVERARKRRQHAPSGGSVEGSPGTQSSSPRGIGSRLEN